MRCPPDACVYRHCIFRSLSELWLEVTDLPDASIPWPVTPSVVSCTPDRPPSQNLYNRVLYPRRGFEAVYVKPITNLELRTTCSTWNAIFNNTPHLTWWPQGIVCSTFCRQLCSVVKNRQSKWFYSKWRGINYENVKKEAANPIIHQLHGMGSMQLLVSFILHVWILRKWLFIPVF